MRNKDISTIRVEISTPFFLVDRINKLKTRMNTENLNMEHYTPKQPNTYSFQVYMKESPRDHTLWCKVSLSTFKRMYHETR